VNRSPADPDGVLEGRARSPKTSSARVVEIGQQVSRDYYGLDPLLVAVLKGAVIFAGDLLRAITIPCAIDFMAISSYGSGTESSGVVRILKDLDAPIAGRHVLVVEDIVDSGLTLSYMLGSLASRAPASLEICALLAKPDRREVDVACRYVGEIPNRFVVGYGLDRRAVPRTAVRGDRQSESSASAFRPLSGGECLRRRDKTTSKLHLGPIGPQRAADLELSAVRQPVS
jgi:hypoxanthine phosphoribosyltransferase